MVSCVSSVSGRNYVDHHWSNLLGRLPVSCPHDRKECLNTQVLVVGLLPISFLKHGDHVIVYPYSTLALQVLERASRPTPAQTAENVHHRG